MTAAKDQGNEIFVQAQKEKNFIQKTTVQGSSTGRNTDLSNMSRYFPTALLVIKSY